MIYKLLKINILVFFGIICNLLQAQNTALYIDEDYNYKKGVELFENNKFAQAQYFFSEVVNYYGTEHTDIKADAEYYLALCSIELFNADAEYRIAQFIAKYPESPRTRVAYFEMGKFKYRNQKFDEALYYFNKVWKQNLSKDQLNEFYFKKGYCCFKLDNLEQSSKLFFEIINKDTKYSGPANYYYAHVNYLEKNYETALNGFIKLENDPTFAPIVPYYIVQIYYLQGKKDKVLEIGPNLLAQPEVKREAEISRLVGEALYANGQYQEALEYLEAYKKKADTYTREDIYQLGYVYYMTGNYEKSVETLSNVTNVDDAITQHAFYHIADGYLKLGKKDQARMAFESTSLLDYDSELKEISLLNYAKLSYELSYSPFNETINAFYNYLTNYPNSIHHDEAYSYLVKVYLTSKNYREALASLDKIKVKSPEMMLAFQRVSFYRGLELFNNLQFSAALAAFEISLQQRNFDKELAALAIYWKAEALYRLNNFAEADDAYNQFLLTPGAYSLPEYNTCYYNLGYTNFKLKNYPQAISWFRKYYEKESQVDAVKRADAANRIGDCYFVDSRYTDAIEFYDKAAAINSIDYDYAMFQQAFSYGLLKNNNQKIIVLTKLLNTSPQSIYASDALYERGRGYMALDSVNQAVNNFSSLLVNYPNSIYVVKSLLQLGLLHYGQAEYQQALTNYKRVVIEYPKTQEANDALLGIKNIYVDMNKVDEYFAFAKEQGGVQNISINEKDSLTYLSAEKIYMSADWSKAKREFNAYIKHYPLGKFTTNAHFYRGDCFLRLQINDSALYDFSLVIDKPKNIFTEPALLYAAQLNAQIGNHNEAYNIYQNLENMAEIKSNLLVARKGQMQSAFSIENYSNAIEAAKKVLITDKVLEEDVRTARLIMGKAYLAQNLMDQALVQFRTLALDIKNIEGAEGKYRVAVILFNQAKIDEAEAEVLEYITIGTPHQYWLAKAFIILSDIYVTKNDRFQAKANLNSLLENYKVTNDGILDEAKQKLEAIIQEENKQFGN